MPNRPRTDPPRKAYQYAADRDWSGYYRVMADKGVRETTRSALDRFDAEPPPAERLAIDLGCGDGRDVAEMARRGWRILAIDDQPEAFDYLRKRLDADAITRVESRLADFRTTPLPESTFINASFALPFCDADRFDDLWRRIAAAIRPGGRFAGQLFGVRDTWASQGWGTFHTREQVEAMLEPFETEMLQEEEKDAQSATGPMKHWHVFHIVARKR